jgi:hypothetical protein
VRVGLGTDSLLCLDTPDRISVLDDMRLLRRRDGVDGLTLLDMATRSGADVLDLRPDLVRLGPQVAGLLAVPCSGVDAPGMLEDALSRSDAPVWAVAPSAGAPQGGATPGKS